MLGEVAVTQTEGLTKRQRTEILNKCVSRSFI